MEKKEKGAPFREHPEKEGAAGAACDAAAAGREARGEQDDEILLDMRRRGRRALIINIVLQVCTLLTAITSLILYFVDDSRGIDITVNHIFQCVGALVVFNVPLIISKRFRCYIPNFITITLYVFAFAHFVLGEIYRAYDNVFLYDKILHTTGGVIFAILSFSVIWLFNNTEGRRVRLSPFFVVLFTFCFTMTVEYLWELVEFGMDRIFGMNMQRWQDSIIDGAQIVVDGQPVDGTAHNIAYGNGLKDSMVDMIVNVLGCLLVCVVSYIGMKHKPNWFENKVILTEKQFRIIKEEKKAERVKEAAQAAAGNAQSDAEGTAQAVTETEEKKE